jgi:hypothetical protein
MIMSRQFRFAAVPLVAGAVVVLTTAAASAFSQETLSPNGNYNFNYGPLDEKKSNDNTSKSDPNSPGFHFNVQSGQAGQFGLFRGFGGNNLNNSAPDPTRPLGNGE